MTRRKYLNPPIKEVVCEFRFSQTSHWNPTVPGLIYEKLREKFPISETGKDIETEIVFENEHVQPKVRLHERAIFRNTEGNMLVQVGTNFLAINHLSPYTDWENFLSIVDEALLAYISIIEECTIERLELRYINEIPFNDGPFDLKEFFDFYPNTDNFNFEDGYRSFIVGVQAEFGDDIQKIQMTNNLTNIILDTTYFTGKPGVVQLEKVIEWLENAHERNNQAFEGSIKESLRSRFREVRE